MTASSTDVSALQGTPGVVWVTGLSGAGKTTFCQAAQRKLKPLMPELLVFDGDGVRGALSQGLGYSEKERIAQFHRMHSLVELVSSQGMFVIVGSLYCNPELSEWNRASLPGYFEVYLKSSLKTVSERDSKGLYAKAAAGAMTDVVGVDIPYVDPPHPDLVFDMDNPITPDEMADLLITSVPRLSVYAGQTAAAAD